MMCGVLSSISNMFSPEKNDYSAFLFAIDFEFLDKAQTEKERQSKYLPT